MMLFLARTALQILGNFVGLVVASWLLQDFHITLSGFVWSLVIFTVAQIILSPFVLKMSLKYVPQLSGGIALIAILVSLIITALVTNGLRITNVATWIAAPFVIWIITVIAGVVLPLFLFKKTLQRQVQRVSSIQQG